MFALFFSLYYAMFMGTFNMYSLPTITTFLKIPLTKVGQLATSIFGDFQITDFGENINVEDWISLVSFVLALITSIGIVVMAVKGIKRIFSVFFYGVR